MYTKLIFVELSMNVQYRLICSLHDRSCNLCAHKNESGLTKTTLFCFFVLYETIASSQHPIVERKHNVYYLSYA